jgi:hypothetical protein
MKQVNKKRLISLNMLLKDLFDVNTAMYISDIVEYNERLEKE